MKLITAIINKSDEKEVTNTMMKGGFSVTKIGSSGSFLKKGVITLISAVHDERVNAALEILRKSTHGQKYSSNNSIINNNYTMELPQEIVVGGATVFVLNIEESYKF